MRAAADHLASPSAACYASGVGYADKDKAGYDDGRPVRDGIVVGDDLRAWGADDMEGLPPLARNGWLLVLLLAAGFLLHYLAGPREVVVSQEPAPPATEQTRRRPARRSGPPQVGPFTLRGPSEEVTLPTGAPVIVHVWLQGCADCMPKFEALRRMRAEGRQLPLPVVNVAYGQADPDWAARYAVEERLVFDRGPALVNPLGIGTLTTLVLDARGVVRLRCYPDEPDYLDQLDAIAGTLAAEGTPSPDPDDPPVEEEPTPTPPAPPITRRTEVAPAWALGAAGGLGVVGLCWGLIVAVIRMAHAPVTAASPEARFVLPQSGPRASGPAGAAPGPTGADPPAVASGAAGVRIERPSARVGRRTWQEELIGSGARCPYCRTGFTRHDEASRCGECLTAYHRPCAEEAGGCVTLGCANFKRPGSFFS